ncbi:hypothetical protein [Streptomyces sp. NPDC049555]|uniref:hypothetical protein n=1 Tax=Streptomyces sp. NPDC049555 TaxID=3154930 RepID=UPI003432F3B2
MSFGQPNNPYGPPPQQPPAPGYGYPQQAPPPYGAYPQAPGGYPMPQGPVAMPGLTKAANVLMYVIAAIHVVVAGFFAYAANRIGDAVRDAGTNGTVTTARGDTVDVDTIADVSKGVISFFVALAAIFAIIGFILAARYGKGRNGVRVGSIVYASFGIISGIFTLGVYGLGLITFVGSILVIVFAAKRTSAEWFQRPRY